MQSIENLLDDLKKIQKEIKSKKDDIDKQAKVAASEAIKSKTPVDSGNLQNSIKPDDEGVFSDVDYAPFVDLGHRTRGGGRFIPGNHMFDEGGEEYQNKVIEELDKLFSNL